MAVGDRIRIVTEEEYRAMSFSRRPRGEKPRTTIRFQQAKIRNLSAIIAELRSEMVKQKTTIARMDVETSELNDHLDSARRRIEDQAAALGQANNQIRAKAERLAFLEGYYAKSAEILPNDPAKTYAGASQGDTKALQASRQIAEGRREETIAGRTGDRPREEIRRFSPNDPAYSDWRPVEGAEIAATRVRDAGRSDMERHRR